MRKTLTRILPLLAMMLVLLVMLSATAFAAGDPTEEPGTKMIECPDCGTVGACMECYGLDPACEACGGTNVCATCGGTGYVTSPSRFFNTAWSLLPPVIAIALALITKEVYSSLFIGIVAGGLLYSNFQFETTVRHVFDGGIVASVTDSYNMGILIFLIILGAMVCLMNKAGGSAAFGRWAKAHIKSRAGVQLVSILLGVLIFIDDYFNCLTVGSVMRPITDKQNISRAKLAYIIDATAAPVCIIAPVSSWAAAVSAFAEDGQGFSLFLRAIPYNYYALLTIVTRKTPSKRATCSAAPTPTPTPASRWTTARGPFWTWCCRCWCWWCSALSACSIPAASSPAWASWRLFPLPTLRWA